VLTAIRLPENVAAPVSYWGASLCDVLESVVSQLVGDPVPTGKNLAHFLNFFSLSNPERCESIDGRILASDTLSPQKMIDAIIPMRSLCALDEIMEGCGKPRLRGDN
jgi:hypothetical protein